MTRSTPGTRVRGRSSRPARRRRPGSCSSSSWRRRSRDASPDHARAPDAPRSRAVRASGGEVEPSPPGTLVGMEREPLDALERPLDGRAMEAEALGELRERRLRRLAAGRGHEPDDGRLLGESAVAVELADRRELAAGRPDRPLEVGRLGVDDAVELAAQRPRDLARLELEERAAGPDPAQEQSRPCRRSSRSRRRGPAGAATTPAGRRRQPRGQRRRVVAGRRRTPGGSDRRQAERSAGEEQPAQVGHPAVLGGRRPSRTAPAEPSAGAGRVARRGPARARPDPGGSPASATRSLASRVAGGEPRGLGARDRTAGAGRSPRAPTGARRRGRVRSGSPLRPSGRRARPSARPALALVQPDDRGREPCRVVVVGVVRVDDVVEDERGGAATDGGQRRRTGSAG